MTRGLKIDRLAGDGEAGFTLVEVLVALALFGLLAALLFGNVRFGLRAWQAGSGRNELLARSAASQDLLRRLIGNAYPMSVGTVGTDPLIDFEGAKDGLSFLADAPIVTGGAGRFRFRLLQEQHHDQTDFVVSSTPELASQDTSMTTKSLLLTDIDHVEFAYSDGRAKGEAAWNQTWAKRSELPKLVRVRIAFRSGDTRLWPDLLIAPRIAADVNCVYDPITKRCRGR